MLDLLVKSAVRRKIIGLFALNADEELYAGQIAKEIEESPHAVGLELKHLVKGGLLAQTGKGRQIFYQWNEKYPYASPIKEAVRMLRRAGEKEIGVLPDLSHRRLIEENLKRIVEDIKKYYEPEKIIVFGSVAIGKIGPDSDIDLVVIKKTSRPYFERIGQLVDLLNYDVGLDLLIYTPEEFERAVRERRFFQEEILKKGKVLYEKEAA